jgi:hypothetical protein
LGDAVGAFKSLLEQADCLWIPHATPGGMLSRLLADSKSRIPHRESRSAS